MTTALIKTLSLAAFLLAAASGCELINFDAPINPYADDGLLPDGGGPVGPAPLYPFRPGSIWQYKVTGLDGSVSDKYVAIDKQQVMVGGVGPHQIDMAYPVRTSGAVGGQPWLVTMQQAVGDQIVNWREETFDQQGQMTLDVNWEPQQLEIDQSHERTRTGVSWVESYTEVISRFGMYTTVKQNESWKVVGQELLELPGIATPFQTVVFQKSSVVGGNDAGTGPSDAGNMGGDAGKTDAAGPGRPMLTSWSEAVDGGGVTSMPKTLWYARSYGKVKEAGGNQPTEELVGLELH
jgi:hypothetical protein